MSSVTLPLLVLAPLPVEQLAVRGPREVVDVMRTGMGPRRAAAAAPLAAERDAAAVAVVGVCGAADPELRAGDLLLATELRRPGAETIRLEPPVGLLAALRDAGLSVSHGPIAGVEHPAGRQRRRELWRSGVSAVDMESSWLADAADGRPLIVLRAIADEAQRSLIDLRLPLAGLRALRSLHRAMPILHRWTAAVQPRTVLLAAPRSFCAGVERAIQVVERTLELLGPPVYVRKQIVHNTHVVQELAERGAVFVDEVDEVPRGATVVFSAHGVSPAVRQRAADRNLQVIDATCPLVNKVHAEARRFARQGHTIFLVGHEGHEEVEGTSGEAEGQIEVVESVSDVARLSPKDGVPLSYLTQTTLSVDETAEVVDALRARFGEAISGPPKDDICYATSNRQQALKAVARESDVVLVVGSENSSNSKRLVEVSQREDTPAYLIDDASEIQLGWLEGADVVGVTAGASAPEHLVEEVVAAVGTAGPVTVEDRTAIEEHTTFSLPKEVR